MFHPRGPAFSELVRQALSSTRDGYDLLAPKFDYTPFRTPDVVVQAAARQLGAPKSIGSALDLCCGTGAGVSAVRPLCRDSVVGIDFSPGMLEVARSRLHDSPGEARLGWVCGDVLRLPFDATFDLAVCFGAHGHILPRDERHFVRQITQALVPGGRFVFATTRMPSLLTPGYWLARGFNAMMRIRNLLLRPPFVMYYLTFLLGDVERLLEAEGFDVDVRTGVFDPPFSPLALVIATKHNRASGVRLRLPVQVPPAPCLQTPSRCRRV